MKGKIDERGVLKIYRGDANHEHYQDQLCPFASSSLGNIFRCGQWCPLFGEPYYEVRLEPIMGGTHKEIKTDKTLLKICQNKTLRFDKFEVLG